MKNFKNNKAFSLIEVAGAIVIVGISIVAVARLFTLGLQNASVREDGLMVKNLLTRKLEEINCRDFADDVSEVDTYYAFAPEYRFWVTQTYPITAPPFDNNDYLKKVEVRITWTDKFGISREEKVTTLIVDKV